MNTEFRYLDISAVTKGRIDWSATQMWKYADAPSRARRRLRSGDVLLCTVRPGLQAHARIRQNEDVPLVGSTGFAVLRPNLADDSGFVFHQIFSDSVAAQLRALETGSSYPAVNEGDVRRVRVFCPEKEERWRIAAVLDTVDEAIAKTEAVVAKLRQVRAGLLHDLLTLGLDPHGQLRDPIAHPEQFQDSPLGRIPHGWSAQTLEQITDPQAPICYGIVQVFDFVPDGVLVLAIRDILGDYATGLHRTAPNIDANYARSRVRPGDVLISIKGTIGRIGLVPSHYVGNITRDLARVRPVERISSTFLVHLLRSPLGQKTLQLAQVGTTRAELSIAPLKRIAFAFPQKDEQEQIAKILNEQDGVIVAHEFELAKLVQLKSGVMTDLLTGRVRLKD
jgi:type I restriction enzyme S subunit